MHDKQSMRHGISTWTADEKRRRREAPMRDGERESCEDDVVRGGVDPWRTHERGWRRESAMWDGEGGS